MTLKTQLINIIKESIYSKKNVGIYVKVRSLDNDNIYYGIISGNIIKYISGTTGFDTLNSFNDNLETMYSKIDEVYLFEHMGGSLESDIRMIERGDYDKCVMSASKVYISKAKLAEQYNCKPEDIVITD